MDHDDTVLPIDPDLAPTDPAQRGAPLTPPSASMHRYRSRAQPDVLAVIALGGMIGATARYAVAQLLPTAAGGFPWATWWTNLSGSFLLGVFLVLVLERFPPTRYLRPFAATGVLGAFTTMSTYQVETALLLKDGHILTGVLYAVGSLVAGLLLAYAGILTGRLIPPRHPEAHR